MRTVTRRVTKKGVAIQGHWFGSFELASMIGQTVSVDVPEGQLPQTLGAKFGAQSLTIQDMKALIERRRAEDPAFRTFLDRIALLRGIDGPSRRRIFLGY